MIAIGNAVNSFERNIVASSPPQTLGSLLRGLRNRYQWTLKEMSAKTGIPVSTLSKIEHDRLTLSYDRLQQLSRRLGLRMSELFVEDDDNDGEALVTARRSLGSVENAFRIETPNYDYYYLCSELRRKRMIPVIAKVRARSLDEFGPLVRHLGEEYFYVIKGKVVVHTDFYDPVTLGQGESMYIDSTMGHAYLLAEDCDEAELLGVMASSDDELMRLLLEIHEEQRTRSSSPFSRKASGRS